MMTNQRVGEQTNPESIPRSVLRQESDLVLSSAEKSQMPQMQPALKHLKVKKRLIKRKTQDTQQVLREMDGGSLRARNKKFAINVINRDADAETDTECEVNEMMQDENKLYEELHGIGPAWEGLRLICAQHAEYGRVPARWKKKESCYEFRRDIESCPPENPNIMYHDDSFLHTRFSMAFASTTDTMLSGPLQSEIRRTYRALLLVLSQEKNLGEVAALGPFFTGKRDQYLFYMNTKMNKNERTNLYTYAFCLWNLRDTMLRLELKDVAIPALDPGLDGILFKTTHALIRTIFMGSGINVHVYSYFVVSLLYEIRDKPLESADESPELEEKIYHQETQTILPVRDGFVPAGKLTL